ncbi:hypothetical protein DVH24_018223 [Malus domestica]|uniref:G protein gamma domain-containing protein n=1 Tax=Malus domestica TaxID=3750 RepID=A0A498KG53_MALDO|nr:hypothetical protein DVH24_018223 [Malus domestica]
MAAPSGSSASVPSLPPPRPKSPPQYPDLYGKRRETARVQMLEREIGFLEEELKSVERLQPASRCCKEVVDFVVANPDPLIPTNRKKRRSCRFWKWLWYHFLFVLKNYKCHAAVTAVCVTVIHVPAVRYQSGDVAAHVPAPSAAKIFHAAEIVAFFHPVHVPIALAQIVAFSRPVHVPIALAQIVANGNALALNVRRYDRVAVVE